MVCGVVLLLIVTCGEAAGGAVTGGRPWGMRHPHRACGGSGAAREHERGSLESMAEGSYFQMRKWAEREKGVQTSRVPVLAWPRAYWLRLPLPAFRFRSPDLAAAPGGRV